MFTHSRLFRPALAAAAILLSAPAAAVDSRVLSREPAPDAPEDVAKLQVLIGDWQCGSSNRQPDGSWQETAFTHEWKWYYTLDGRAVQDYWLPDPESPGTAGTNLRMYDPEKRRWFIAWSTTDMTAFDYLSATHDGGEMVLTGHKDATAEVPEHERRITFHNMSEEHFDWRYQAKGAQPEAEWREVARLSCNRADS